MNLCFHSNFIRTFYSPCQGQGEVDIIHFKISNCPRLLSLNLTPQAQLSSTADLNTDLAQVFNYQLNHMLQSYH